MASIDFFKHIYGYGSVIDSIKDEHIDKVFEAIGDLLPDKMTEFHFGFVLLWEDVYFDHGLSEWYTNLVNLLESIEKEFDFGHFSIETATWNSCDASNIDINLHGDLGGFEPLIRYDMHGTEIDLEQFVKND
jgi:hypothetical protein